MATWDKGGLGMQQTDIGKIMTLTGGVLLVYTFFIYPFDIAAST